MAYVSTDIRLLAYYVLCIRMYVYTNASIIMYIVPWAGGRCGYFVPLGRGPGRLSPYSAGFAPPLELGRRMGWWECAGSGVVHKRARRRNGELDGLARRRGTDLSVIPQGMGDEERDCKSCPPLRPQ